MEEGGPIQGAMSIWICDCNVDKKSLQSIWAQEVL